MKFRENGRKRNWLEGLSRDGVSSRNVEKYGFLDSIGERLKISFVDTEVLTAT